MNWARASPSATAASTPWKEYRRMADAFYARRIAKYPDLKGDALLKRLEEDWAIVDQVRRS